MYRITFAKQYQKSIKKLVKSGVVSLEEVNAVVNLIAEKHSLPTKYRDHKLTGELQQYRECHIRPDVLLQYRLYRNELILLVVDIGSHANLFG